MEGEKDYFIIGKILKPFGVSGEIKVLPITDDVKRFKDLPFAYLKKDGRYIKVLIKNSKIINKYVLLKLDNIESIDEAEKYRNEYLYIDRDNAADLPENSYYYYDIWKCVVVTTDGKEFGVVEDIQNAGSCDIYVVRLKNSEDTVLIPAISDVIKKIDIKSKRIVIELIDGLI